MSNNTETAAERLARLKREKEAAKEAGGTDLVSQLTHESDGEPDFAELAEKLKNRKEGVEAAKPEWIKFTIYIDRPVAEAFQALCTERGDQRRYATAAFADFVKKKSKELGL